MSGSVRLAGDDPSSAVGLAHSPLEPASASDSPQRFRHASPRTLAARDLALRRSPAVSERASMRCPGAVTPPRRLARGSVRPRPASSPEERILRQPSGSLAMPRPEDRSAARLPSFRRRGLGGPPSIPTKTWRSRNLVCGQGRENGESGGGERESVGGPQSCEGRREPAAGRPRSRLNPAARLPASPGDVRDRRSVAMRDAKAGEELDLFLARRPSGVSHHATTRSAEPPLSGVG
jgi:hypothetical protein